MITEQQYNELRKRYDDYHAWRNGRNAIHVNEIPEHLRISNDEISAIEVYEFVANPPDKYFAYVKLSDNGGLSCSITTWTGDHLGLGTLGLSYISNMGDKRRSIRVKAINGKSYYGTFYESAGDYCRLTAVKESK